MRKILLYLVIIFIVGISCNNSTESTNTDLEYKKNPTENKNANEIVYSMCLPTDMAYVFSYSAGKYLQNVPAPTEDLFMYDDNEQIAVMLGVYGVDLMYMKLLDQSEPAAHHYKAIELLSEKAGIPVKKFQESERKLEKSFNNKDTLLYMIDRLYKETNTWFKENGKDNLVALSLVGGWIEAMYIGIEILETDRTNKNVEEILMQQKFSLNNIYTILSNYQESLTVKSYLLMLKKLKKLYDEVDIKYQKEGFSIDTTKKKIQTFGTSLNYEQGTLEKLSSFIPKVREKMIMINVQE